MLLFLLRCRTQPAVVHPHTNPKHGYHSKASTRFTPVLCAIQCSKQAQTMRPYGVQWTSLNLLKDELGTQRNYRIYSRVIHPWFRVTDRVGAFASWHSPVCASCRLTILVSPPPLGVLSLNKSLCFPAASVATPSSQTTLAKRPLFPTGGR